MKLVIAVVLVLAVAVNGGVITTSHQIQDAPVALHAPLVHGAATPLLVHTSSSSSYKVRAPAAKLVHTAPSLPIVHAMSPPILLH